MKLTLAIYTERLHRYVFNTYYVQEYAIGGLDHVVIALYNTMLAIVPNWRTILKDYFVGCKRYKRYN